MADDTSPWVKDWTDRKIWEDVDAKWALAVAAPTPELRLGYLGQLTALVEVLKRRAADEIERSGIA